MVGFTSSNQSTFDSIYTCSKCLLLLKNPVQIIICGHRLCESCADEQEGDMVTCSECNQKVSRENLKPDRGFRNDMQTLSIICSLCNWNGLLKNYQNHLDQNHPHPICKYCNEKFTSVNDLNHHQRFICQKVTVSCPLNSLGCDEKITRVDFVKHYSSEQHQRALINFIRQIRTEKSSQITFITIEQLNETNELINSLSKGIDALGGDVKRLSTESIQCQTTLQSISEKLPKLAKSIDEHNTFVDNLIPYQANLQQNILSMKHQFDDFKSVSYDGTYIWKITDVHNKIIAAQSGTQTSIYSSPFYSSSAGYKCCLRLFLNGDGNALETHMSLFFVLMRGEYDAILTFPFCFKVLFCLYDQTNQQNHITDIFRPDLKSSSFQRPRSETNTPCGVPKFVDLKILKQENNPYIRDDTMFIKVMIDFDNISKDIIPYAFHLNPGLTTGIQQTLIRQQQQR